MSSKKIMEIKDRLGNKTQYEILSAFKLETTGKHYLIYTDNTLDLDNNLNVYAAIYYPNDPTRLDLIETKEEWDEIEKQLKLLKETNPNE